MAHGADTLADSIVVLRRRAEANGWANVEFLLGLAEVAALKEETRPGLARHPPQRRWGLPWLCPKRR